ncbi:unnamed protein product [Amoebophrya sp. A120]|nr:unnamed protein product [Amoebophrya sp. A120]|eukprot:GSA120T00007248001.1
MVMAPQSRPHQNGVASHPTNPLSDATILRELQSLKREEHYAIFAKKRKKALPIVVVTGFLGSGKTTLLRHVCNNRLNLRLATCVHEAATVNIDSHLIAGDKARKNEGVSNLREEDGNICKTPDDDVEEDKNYQNDTNKTLGVHRHGGQQGTNYTTSNHDFAISGRSLNGFFKDKSDHGLFAQIKHQGWVIPLHGGGCCGCDRANYESSLTSTLKIFLTEGIDEGNLDYVLLELSGAEDPFRVCDMMNKSFGSLYRVRLDQVVCVIDCSEVLEYDEAKMELVFRQLENADSLVLNKLEFLLEEVYGAGAGSCDKRTSRPTEGGDSALEPVGPASTDSSPEDGSFFICEEIVSPEEEERRRDELVERILKKLNIATSSGKNLSSSPTSLPITIAGAMMRDVAISKILAVTSTNSDHTGARVVSHEQSETLKVLDPYLNEEPSDDEDEDDHAAGDFTGAAGDGNLAATNTASISSKKIKREKRREENEVALDHLIPQFGTLDYNKSLTSLEIGNVLRFLSGLSARFTSTKLDGNSHAATTTSTTISIWRAKGVLHVGKQKWVWNLSGDYRMDLTVEDWENGITPYSKLTLIGTNLDRAGVSEEEIAEELEGPASCAASSANAAPQSSSKVLERLREVASVEDDLLAQEAAVATPSAGTSSERKNSLVSFSIRVRTLFPYDRTKPLEPDVDFFNRTGKSPDSFPAFFAQQVADQWNRRKETLFRTTVGEEKYAGKPVIAAVGGRIFFCCNQQWSEAAVALLVEDIRKQGLHEFRFVKL